MTSPLPCPFCGSEADLRGGYTSKGNRFWCGCSSVECDAEWANPEQSPEQAIARWNTRAPSDREANLTALREAVREYRAANNGVELLHAKGWIVASALALCGDGEKEV